MSHPSRFFTHTMLFLVITVFVAGCIFEDDSKNEHVYGIWPGEYSSVLTVTRDFVNFGSWGGEIVEMHESDRYLLLRYTNNAFYSDQIGRYNKLIWRFEGNGILWYSEGYEASMTNAAGEFIGWPDTDSVRPLTNIFVWGTYATNY